MAVGAPPIYVGEAPSYVGETPMYVGDPAWTVGPLPVSVEVAPIRVGCRAMHEGSSVTVLLLYPVLPVPAAAVASLGGWRTESAG